MEAVRAERELALEPVPPLCVLDFDGDLSDHLAEQQMSLPWTSWACFHTSMRVADIAGTRCGIVPRTIGGPYSVLIAEQLWAAGAKLIVGLTSAGRVSPNLPLPSIVVVNDAIRDEGTSLHYVAPTASVRTPTQRVVEPLITELSAIAPHVFQGRVWTTDAPYRETREQLDYWATQNVLAVEMQAASLFAFASFHDLHMVDVVLQKQVVRADLVDDFESLLRAAQEETGYVASVDRLDQQMDSSGLQSRGGVGKVAEEHLARSLVICSSRRDAGKTVDATASQGCCVFDGLINASSKLVFPTRQARDAALTLGPVTGRQVMQDLNELMVFELLTESVGFKSVRE
jgi:uridine phosphorylase